MQIKMRQMIVGGDRNIRSDVKVLHKAKIHSAFHTHNSQSFLQDPRICLYILLYICR